MLPLKDIFYPRIYQQYNNRKHGFCLSLCRNKTDKRNSIKPLRSPNKSDNSPNGKTKKPQRLIVTEPLKLFTNMKRLCKGAPPHPIPPIPSPSARAPPCPALPCPPPPAHCSLSSTSPLPQTLKLQLLTRICSSSLLDAEYLSIPAITLETRY